MTLLQDALKMHKAEEKLNKCLKEGEKAGARHKGLRKIKPSKELASDHLKKAMHNFSAMNFFYKNGFSDWSASAAFYTLYHCLLAILSKYGYESRNQSCTFAMAESLISKGEIKNISIDDIKDIFDSYVVENLEHSPKILDIRENMQYSTKTSIESEEFAKLKQKTVSLLEKFRMEIEK